MLHILNKAWLFMRATSYFIHRIASLLITSVDKLVNNPVESFQ